jgi:hypothetical protein
MGGNQTFCQKDERKEYKYFPRYGYPQNSTTKIDKNYTQLVARSHHIYEKN